MLILLKSSDFLNNDLRSIPYKKILFHLNFNYKYDS